MKHKILIIEDDNDVLNLISGTFEKTGDFDTLSAHDGAEGLRLARRESPDALLLDLMLPGMTGLEVCRALRADPLTRQLAILMITAKADEFDRISGFELGADDYVVKPFSPRELVLRVRAVIRRRQPPATTDIQAGPIALDWTRHYVTVDGKPLRLTSTEFKLLASLLEGRGRVQARDRLLNQVWGYQNAIDTRTVDTHIRRLREKLGKFGAQIQTIRGFGYRLKDSD